jgi:nucleoside-diphosphate-sugar epimerase
MDVLMTGPYGRVGSALRRQLRDREEYDFTYLDVQDHPDHDTVVADATDYYAIRRAFEGQDAVVHLALVPELGSHLTEPAFARPLEAQVRADANVLRAAVDAGVERVVYASTNQVVKQYKRDQPDPEDPDVRVDHTVPVRPDSLYSLAKVFGEAFGRYCVEAHGLRFYGLRLCTVHRFEADHPYARAEWGVEAGEWERDSDAYEENVIGGNWLSHRDLAQLVDRCLRDETVTFDVFNGVSDNDNRYLEIEHAREVLGYDPQDDVTEWDGPPGRE